MSAGYNLEGIKSSAVQRFLDRMENAEEDVKRIKAGLASALPRHREDAHSGPPLR